MNEVFDIEAWRNVVLHSITELGGRLASFLPSLVGAVLILAIGWLVSKLVEIVTRRALARLGLDRTAERLRLGDTLRRAGVGGEPSDLLATLLFWVLMLTFVLSAVETLGLTAVTVTIDRLISYLPHVIAAALIFLIGLLLGRLARNVVSSGAAAASVREAQRLGAAAQTSVVAVVAVLALGQLGVQTELLVTVITSVVATVGLTMGIAFALGARGVVAHILAGHYLRQSLPPGRPVEVRGRRGVVERVGPVDTLFRDGDSSWSCPNAQLLEEVVQR